MPPDSTELWQEGAAVKSFFLVRDGHFDEEGIVSILLQPGQYPECTGSRRLGDNMSDLKAQVAANRKGTHLIDALMREYGKATVHRYMAGIQQNAEVAVRNYLKSVYSRFHTSSTQPVVTLKGHDALDNGSSLEVAAHITPEGDATFDFAGTTCQMRSNMNAPPAITYSALIYTLRLLIGMDIPLNQGCLAPATVILPNGSLLNPASRPWPAVCCGNTLTSQRLVDLFLKTFRAAADSQGCMNCLGFMGICEDGSESGSVFGYGETICGGEGAGPTWHGASAVQVHMTNTRTTDPEIMEKRLPIMIREFSIRHGSGGRGQYNGGCGVIRDFECRHPLTFGLITERRVHRPHGMEGGEDGQQGRNYWVQKTEEGYRWVDIGARGQVKMQTGDRCVIHTPGGGGWGVKEETPLVEERVVNGNGLGGHMTYPRATGSLSNYAATQEASS